MRWVALRRKLSLYLSRNVPRSVAPLMSVPSYKVPVGSILAPSSVVRKRPTASNDSSANPIGSIRRWQPWHDGLDRCSSSISRMEGGIPLPAAFASLGGSSGILGGGGGGSTPIKLDKVQ